MAQSRKLVTVRGPAYQIKSISTASYVDQQSRVKPGNVCLSRFLCTGIYKPPSPQDKQTKPQQHIILLNLHLMENPAEGGFEKTLSHIIEE